MGRIGLSLQSAACAPIGLLTLLVIAPIIEETVFRYGLQNWLNASFPTGVGCVSLANVMVALIFGAMHSLHQGSIWMLLTTVPALLFGWVWELSAGRLIVPVLLHAWYNLCIVLLSCH